MTVEQVPEKNTQSSALSPQSFLRGKRTLVMGLGLHDGGLGVTRFLVEQGAQVRVTDLRSAETLAPTLQKLESLPVEYILGEHREEDFRWAEIVVKNPAVPRESRFLEIARQAGATIEMEMTLFFRLCPSPFIFGITGTRGKTTTTLLAGAMLRAWKPDTVIAGNLRVSALAKLPEIKADTPIALELSSWQLESFEERRISPPFAVVTNMSPDHLNRYRDMEDYANAKRNIYRHQNAAGVVVLNADNAIVKQFAEDAPGRVLWFSLSPLPSGQAGVYMQNVGQIEGGSPLPRTRQAKTVGQPSVAGQAKIIWRSFDQTEQEIGAVALVKLVGRHNLANALAAIALVKAGGCPDDAIRQALNEFNGVPDRLELIRELNGVRYYNDTTSTSPAGAVAALEAFQEAETVGHQPNIILIAGGADKKLDFAPMAAAIANPANAIKAIILLDGTATPRLQAAMQEAGVGSGLISEPYSVFKAAVERAHELVKPGDIVLLSPGCASFGMFTHEFDRGQQFRDLVLNFEF